MSKIQELIKEHTQAHGTASLSELEDIFIAMGYEYFEISPVMRVIAEKVDGIEFVVEHVYSSNGVHAFTQESLMTQWAIDKDLDAEYLADSRHNQLIRID